MGIALIHSFNIILPYLENICNISPYICTTVWPSLHKCALTVYTLHNDGKMYSKINTVGDTVRKSKGHIKEYSDCIWTDLCKHKKWSILKTYCKPWPAFSCFLALTCLEHPDVSSPDSVWHFIAMSPLRLWLLSIWDQRFLLRQWNQTTWRFVVPCGISGGVG